MNDDELYALLVNAHLSGQNRLIDAGQRTSTAYDYADRIMSDLKEKNSESSDD